MYWCGLVISQRTVLRVESCAVASVPSESLYMGSLILPLLTPLDYLLMSLPQKCIRIAANLTSTLLAHYIAPKLETILDREAKISHEAFAGQIEARIGYGEGDKAKGPDMKVWSKGRGLNDVSGFTGVLQFYAHSCLTAG